MYTDEKNVQILISLMKKNKIRKVIVSPGATNISFVASIQSDPFFELYSCVDERSAAYMACGLSEESGEVVALSCTGATASRNYISGLTEAFYRKLPILAITSTQFTGRIGHNVPQVIDRSTSMNDIKRISVELPTVYTTEDEWSCCIKANEAIQELFHNGGGPVHINLTTTYSTNYSCRILPVVPHIKRISINDTFPKISNGKIAIFVGAHKKWNKKLVGLVEKFCKLHNAAVLYDHTSNYVGSYGTLANLVTNQEIYKPDCLKMDLLIHIGNISGAYMGVYPNSVWRINPDGKICDTFKKLEYVFEMEEEYFFDYYTNFKEYKTEKMYEIENTYAITWQKERKRISDKVPMLPLSNIWIAQQISKKLPENCVVHFGILNSLRAWNMFEFSNTICGYANTGGFGIDGCLSSLIGASLAFPEKLYFGIFGDLSFFYDMNSIGNKHIGNNLRILVINNGIGAEFKNYNHKAAIFKEEADTFIAASGHFGNKSPMLLKHYAKDLGFNYYSASTKEEFLESLDRFVSNNMFTSPIIFEVFTSPKDESEALRLISQIDVDGLKKKTNIPKKIIKEIIGESGINTMYKIIEKIK